MTNSTEPERNETRELFFRTAVFACFMFAGAIAMVAIRVFA